MTYRRCGRSGILLPAISLGLWHNFGDVNPLSRSKEILHHAFDQGIVSFDLANNYGPSYGSAEETFGIVMQKSFRPYRDEIFIATKAGYDMWPGPYGNWGSRKYLISSLDQSLKRMNLDYVDIFYSHRYDPETPLEETLTALVDIVRQGKALYIGISRWPKKAMDFAKQFLSQRDAPCLLFQDKLNIFDRAPETSGMLTDLENSGIGFIAFSPLAQGLLTNRYLHGIPADSRAAAGKFLSAANLTHGMMEKITNLNRIAASRDQSLAQMALAWLLRKKEVTSVIVGCSSIAQLDDSISSLANLEFTSEQLAEIDNLAGIQLTTTSPTQ